jgi:hypothetical protein
MSTDTVFRPMAPTVLVTNASAVQLIDRSDTAVGTVMSLRIVNLSTSAQRFGWGVSASGTSSTGPAGAGLTNAVYSVIMGPGGVETMEFPSTAFFIAATSTGFEMTPGQGP